MDWHKVQNFGPQMKNLSGVIRNLAPHARPKIRVRGRRSLSGSLDEASRRASRLIRGCRVWLDCVARTISGYSQDLSTTPFEDGQDGDRLLTAEGVAQRLNVTKGWVWDHSSRKAPYLPVIRMGDGTLRHRASRMEEFIDERERLTQIRRKRA
jgi:hypothetical protein